jgi:hypothetical protein
MKRIILFLATNLAVMLVLSVVLSIFGIGRPGPGQMQMGSLLAFSAVVGFTGSIISLLMSKPMAKWSTGARVIDTPQNSTEQWLVSTAHGLADRAGIGRPEVAVYEGEPNAFATGAFKNDALVAVSTGLLQGMNREEVEAVLGHEVAHIANGDMVTLTLIQGVVNTFVVFLARIGGRAPRTGHRLYHYGVRVRTGVWPGGVDDRGLVLAPARIPRRRRFRQAAGQHRTDAARAGPPGRPASGRTAARHGRIRHHVAKRLGSPVLQPSAHRRAHRRIAEFAVTQPGRWPIVIPPSCRWL